MNFLIMMFYRKIKDENEFARVLFHEAGHAISAISSPDYAKVSDAIKIDNEGEEYTSYFVEGDHEAIITREVWDKVQERLKGEKERKANGIYSSSREHFMHGILFCGECGMPLTRKTFCCRGESKKMWKCKGRIKDYKSCNNDAISEEELYAALAEALGIKLNGADAVTEATFEKIKRVELFGDGHLEIEMD